LGAPPDVENISTKSGSRLLVGTIVLAAAGQSYAQDSLLEHVIDACKKAIAVTVGEQGSARPGTGPGPNRCGSGAVARRTIMEFIT
jgi:hypothetical protein